MIFGIGTGRCGTQSLSDLLDRQTNHSMTHEFEGPIPWEFSKDSIKDHIQLLKDNNLTGDIGFYFLPYIEYIIAELDPNVRFPCLKRDRAQTIKSYDAKSGSRNFWKDHDGSKWVKDDKWNIAYPNYDTEDKLDAIGQYYDEYYSTADALVLKYPDNVKVFSVDDLNTTEGVEKILTFCSIENPIIEVSISANELTKKPWYRRVIHKIRTK
ncbi:MAG: hypothetical protein HRT71_15875 [Flavobacteriales bacterium]|nr:hypothetical protein [Flavobacteriales bacterium]